MKSWKVLMFRLLLTSVLWRDTGCYEMAKLLSRGRVAVTSSTLAWYSISPSDPIPPNAVKVGNDGPPWCRLFDHAVYVPGAVLDGKCHAPFFRSVSTADTFQVLVSQNQLARVELIPWDHLTALPSKIVSSPNMLLALSNASDIPPGLPGFVEPERKKGYFLLGNESILSRSGLLVTEEEPIAYRLTHLELNKTTKRLILEEDREFELENPSTTLESVEREVEFVSPHVVSFGKIKGVLVTLPLNVSGLDTFPLTLRWVINNELSQNRTHVLSRQLPPRSYVRIRLVSVIRHLEGTYSARLTSVYNDGVELVRNITGSIKERRIAELRAKYDQVMSIENEAPLAEWPSTSETLLYSTTTTPAPPPDQNGDIPQAEEVSGNGSSSQSAFILTSLLPLMIFFVRW